MESENTGRWRLGGLTGEVAVYLAQTYRCKLSAIVDAHRGSDGELVASSQLKNVHFNKTLALIKVTVSSTIQSDVKDCS